jgi:hypothetical protein
MRQVIKSLVTALLTTSCDEKHHTAIETFEVSNADWTVGRSVLGHRGLHNGVQFIHKRRHSSRRRCDGAGDALNVMPVRLA